MRNPIIGFCRVKDVKYNQFERDGDRSLAMWYDAGGIDESDYDTKEEYKSALRSAKSASDRMWSQDSYDGDYYALKPYFGKVVPLAYKNGEFYIIPEPDDDSYLYDRLIVRFRWIDIVDDREAFREDDQNDEIGTEELVGEFFSLVPKNGHVAEAISSKSVCGVHMVFWSNTEKHSYITRDDLREIYNNIGDILGVKK